MKTLAVVWEIIALLVLAFGIYKEAGVITAGVLSALLVYSKLLVIYGNGR